MSNFVDVTKYILYQQLYSEPDKIRDRRSTTEIEVEGSGKILLKMQELILSDIELWIKGEEEEYIVKLSKKLGLKSNIIIRRFHDRIEPLSKKQLSDANFKFLLILSEVIKKIHEIAVNGVIEEIKEEFSSKQLTKINKIMQSLSEQNDLDFSLLLNLVVLRQYAIIVKEKIPLKAVNEYYRKILLVIEEELKKK